MNQGHPPCGPSSAGFQGLVLSTVDPPSSPRGVEEDGDRGFVVVAKPEGHRIKALEDATQGQAGAWPPRASLAGSPSPRSCCSAWFATPSTVGAPVSKTCVLRPVIENGRGT